MRETALAQLTDAEWQVHRFFTVDVPQSAGRLLLDDYKNLTCRFDVLLVERDGAAHRIGIRDGHLLDAARTVGPPEVSYTLDAETFLDIVTARTTPQDAFYAMRVDILGDMEVGLELGAVFEDFFRFYPYVLKERDRHDA